MGFGSYDESEQETGKSNEDEEDVEAVNVHESDHDGDMQFEAGASEDELLDQLQDMKD